ncbi:extracellular solute-binding protein [Mycoplasmatota bacterium]|nr:extracellular solute-binding protein [Mycoplasmatota bacterium]
MFRKFSIVSILLFVLILSFSLIKPVQAEIINNINVQITSSQDKRFVPGHEFSIDIFIENAHHISGFQLGFEYDETLFQLTGIGKGEQLNSNIEYNTDILGEIKITYSEVTNTIEDQELLFSISFMPLATYNLRSYMILQMMDSYDQMLSWVDVSNEIHSIESFDITLSPIYKGVFGDVNFDTYVDIVDVAYIQQYLIGLRDFNPEQIYLADVNSDDKVNITDVGYIQQFIVGLREYLGEGDASFPEIVGLFDNHTYYKGTADYDILDGVKAFDEEDGDITEDINIVGSYTLSRTGSYTVYVTVEDSDGNLINRQVSITVKDLTAYTIPEELTSDNIEIELWHSNGATVESALIGYAEDFETLYPNVTVNIVANGANYDELRQNVINSNLNGQLPNIVQNYPEHVMEYLNNGLIIPLTPFIYDNVHGYNPNFDEESLLDIQENFRRENSQYTSDGEYYSVPFNKSTEVMIYNKNMMDALISEGIIDEVPNTWQGIFEISDDLRRVATQEGGIIDQIVDTLNQSASSSVHKNAEERQNIKDNFVPITYDSSANAFITLTRQWGGQYTTINNERNGILLFDNPQTKETLSYFYDHRDEDDNPDAFTVPNRWGTEYGSDAFKTGQTAISIISTGGARYNTPTVVNNEYSFDFGVVPMPYNADMPQNRTAIQQGNNMSITTAGTDQEKLASWLFLKFLTSKNVQLDFALETGYSPVRRSVYSDPAYIQFTNGLDSDGSPLAGEMLMKSKAANAAMLQADYLFFDQAFVGQSNVRGIVDDAFTNIILRNDLDKEVLIDEEISYAYNQSNNILPKSLNEIYNENIEDIFSRIMSFPYKDKWGNQDSSWLIFSPTSYDKNSNVYDVSWTSSHPDIISLDGLITQPEYANVDVTISASITVEGVEYVKYVVLTVEKSPEGTQISSIAEAIALGIDAYVEILGVTVVAMYDSGDVFFTDGTDILYIYSPPFDAVVGGVYDITGLIDFYYNTPQLAGTDTYPLRAVSSDAAVTSVPVVSNVTVNDIIATTSVPSADNPHEYITYEVTASVYYEESWGNYSLFLVPTDYDFNSALELGATQPNGDAIMIYYKSDMDALKALHGQEITIEIVMQGYRPDKTVFYANFFNHYPFTNDGMPTLTQMQIETMITRGFDHPEGGMDLVTLHTVHDGDTAAFTPGFLGGERVRFLGVNTPETSPTVAPDGPEPWGLEATAYTKTILEYADNNNLPIYIQSDPDLGYTEGYGRHLGLVWVDLGSNVLLIDVLDSNENILFTEELTGVILLNYLLVKNGFSSNLYSTDSTIEINNRLINKWFDLAEYYAKTNKLGIYE